MRRAVGGVLRGRAHRELVHVGLAEDRQAGLAEPVDHGGVVRRHPALEDPRAARRGQTLVASTSLTAIGTPSRPVPCVRRATLVGGTGLLERTLGVDVQEGVDGAVDRGDPVEVRLGELDGGGLAGGERVGELGGGAAGPVGGRSVMLGSSPRIRGTENRCSSTAGAPESASSAVRPG